MELRKEKIVNNFKNIINDYFKFPFYILTHPIKGFEELKFEKKGKVSVMVVYLVLMVLSIIYVQTSVGFLINPQVRPNINIIKTAALVIVPVFLAAVGNWTVTSLLDGKGKVYEILMVVCYSLIPFVWFSIPLTFISNFLTLDEVTFYATIYSLSVLLSGYMLFMGLLVIHEYGLFKTILTVLFTIVAIAIIVFLAILVLTLIQQVYSFAESLYREFIMRIR